MPYIRLPYEIKNRPQNPPTNFFHRCEWIRYFEQNWMFRLKSCPRIMHKAVPKASFGHSSEGYIKKEWT